MTGTVHTVLGEIDASEVGRCYPHEHLLTMPGPHLLNGTDDMVLDSLEKSAAELGLFKQAGGGTIVEVSCSEYGRDGAGLAEVSRRSGVHVVAATGHIMEGYWRGVIDLSDRTVASLVDEMVHDLTEGFPEAPDVRARIIKVGTSRDAPHPDEVKMLTAAAIVQRDLGVPITTHTTKGTIPLEQIRIFEEAGADLSKVCIGHQDLKLDYDQHLDVVKAGCFIGYDSISKEHYGPDATRVEYIKRLVEAGYGDRVLLAGDIARKSYLTSYGGGPGFTYILWRFVPWLWQAGVSREATDRMLIDNPARLLAWTK